jgi:hypothetical protein
MHLGDNHSKHTKILCFEVKKPKHLENCRWMDWIYKKIRYHFLHVSFTPTTSSNLNVEWPSKPKRLDENLIYKVWP